MSLLRRLLAVAVTMGVAQSAAAEAAAAAAPSELGGQNTTTAAAFVLHNESGTASQGETVTFHKIPAMQAGTGGYAAFGIPSLLSVNNTLLAFCEGRKFSCADSPGQHDILCQRSEDGGSSWVNCAADSVAIVDVSKEWPMPNQWGSTCAGRTTTCGAWDPTPVVERESGKLFVFFSLSAPNATAMRVALLMIESNDMGRSFGPIRNIAGSLAGTVAEVLLPAAKWWDSAPGTFTGNPGIQLESGRLVVPMYHATPENISIWPDVSARPIAIKFCS
jgi:hypothetical protein